MSAAAPHPVAVVVPSYNSAAVLRPCLQAALEAAPQEVVVVDNASTDGSAALVREHFPQVRLLPQPQNTGFAAACNLGVAHSNAPYVLFLNDDAELSLNYLQVLVAALQARPQVASAVGKLLRPPLGSEVIDSAGLRLDRYALRPTDRGQGQPDRGQYDRMEYVFGPSGAAALYRRAALDGAPPPGGRRAAQVPEAAFDASLFAYYEDVDLAWRLRRRGWKHLYVPATWALHARRGPGHLPLPVAARAFVNRYRIWCRHESPLRFASYAPLALGWEGARLARLGVRNPRLLAAIGGHLLQTMCP